MGSGSGNTFNISETTGTFTGSGTAGVDQWTTTVDLRQKGFEVVSGDFDEVEVSTSSPGDNDGEANGGYSFSSAADGTYGTLTFDSVDGTFTFVIDRRAAIDDGITEIRLTAEGREGGETDTDTVIIQLVICVEKGTMVGTPSGERPVETLAVGDLVCVVDGDPAPLRWIGARAVPQAEVEADPMMGPVRIAPDSFGPGRPARPLTVSAQHRVLVDDPSAELLFDAPEVLAPAIGLVGLPGVTAEAPRDVTWYHLLFDAHQVILTDGLPTESFYPGAWSLGALGDEGRAQIARVLPSALSPDLYGPSARPGLKVWEARLLARGRKAVA